MQETLDQVQPDPRFAEEPAVEPVLDLDALEVVRTSVVLAGGTYLMKNKQDMSMVDREELRLCLMQIADLQEQAPAKDGRHTSGHRKALDDLEIRLVALALPDLPRSVLTDEEVLTPARRNALIERFFTEVDVLGTVQSFVATMRRANRNSTSRPSSAPLTALRPNDSSGNPPLPPVDLLARKPSSTTTPSATPTSS